jgi:hypothetical protein
VIDCGLDEQTPEHILKDCPLLTDLKEAWPEHSTYHAKLWGTEAELRCTAAFLENNNSSVAQPTECRRRKIPFSQMLSN